MALFLLVLHFNITMTMSIGIYMVERCNCFNDNKFFWRGLTRTPTRYTSIDVRKNPDVIE